MLQFSKSKKFAIFLTVLLGFMFASPNVLPPSVLDDLPDWYPHDKISLGLDLQGGTYVLLEVDVAAVRTERANALADDVRRILRSERIRFTDLRVSEDNIVTLNIRNEADLARAYDMIEDLSVPVSTSILVAASESLEVTQSGNTITLSNTEEGLNQINTKAVEQSVESVRRRIDELGTKEPTVARQGDTRILVQVPGETLDPTILNQTAKLSFHLVDITVTQDDIDAGRIPPRSMALPMAGAVETTVDGEELPPFMIAVQKRAMVSGENLTDANPGFDQRNGLPLVSISFDSRGAQAFCRVTQENVNRQFAIVLDDEIISAPVINEAICQGRAQISGSFTVESATELAALLRAGALPAPLIVMEQRDVGPGLGADSIKAGKLASMVALAAVVFFILIYYRGFGLATNVALFINLVLIAGALSLLGATLTLPGFAGIVLTIGMAVDANVLVFERIREELRTGKMPLQAVSAGYSSAMSTIMDANITTLIAAIVMFQYGTGPVRGFAVTLSIGIISSVFSAVTLTRFMVATWLKRTRPKTLKA
ncbi:MAG: protein translocase subunit SecD [Sphingomonadales bacterium]